MAALRSIFQLFFLLSLLVCSCSAGKGHGRKHIKGSRVVVHRILQENKAADAKKYTITTPMTTVTPTVPGTTPTSTSPYTNPGATPTTPGATNPTAPVSGVQSWCVARSNVPDKSLQTALDYACGLGGVDCRTIQKGGSCFDPDTVVAHASWAFNNYFQSHNMAPGTCDFGGNAIITTSNPSYATCAYPLGSSGSTGVNTPTTPTTGTGTTPTTGTGTTPTTGTGTTPTTGTGTTPVTTVPGGTTSTPPGTFATPGYVAPPPPGAMMTTPGTQTGGITTPGTFPGISMGPNAGYNNSPPYDASSASPIAMIATALSWLGFLLVAAVLG